MKHLGHGLAAAAILFPGLAAAQSAPVDPFAGAHVEALLGYDKQQAPFPGDAADSGGLLYGVAGGYDVRRGNLVFGGEAELTGASTDTRADSVYAAGDRITINAGRDLYAGGRIGYVVAPTTLLYGKLGYTNARADVEYRSGTVGGSTTRGETSGGIRAGAGAEVAIVGNTFVKGEYRYSDYGGRAIDHRHQFVLGAGFRF